MSAATMTRSARRAAAELLAFLAASVVMTWPMAAHLSDRVPNQGDPLLTAWVLPWTVRAVVTRPLQLFQGNIFHPEPNTLAYMDHMVAAAPVAAPAWLATGDGILVNNVVVIVLIALGGWSAYRLALDVTRSRSASAVAGVIFAFSPYVFSHISHTNLLTTYALPATWLFARRVVRSARASDALGLAVAWVLVVLSSWYYGAFISLSLVGLVGAEALVRRETLAWKRVAVLLAVPAVAVAAVALIFSRPYLDVQERYPQSTRTIVEAESYSITPRSMLAAPPGNRVYGEATAALRPETGFNEKTMFVGIVPVVLALAALVIAFRRRRPGDVLPWVTAGALMFVVAFGPFLPIGSSRFRLPFYYLYSWVEPLRFIRAPGRAAVLVTLAVAVLAAMALAAVGDRRRRIAACAVAAVIVGIEFTHVPVSLQPAPRPGEVYRVLDASEVEGALVELPTVPMAGGRPLPGTEVREARYAAFSTEHFRPILNGYSGFFPPSHQRMVREMQSFPSESSLRFLRERGVAFVTLHLDLLPRSPWEALLSGIDDPSLELVADDGEVRLYRLL